MDVSRVKFRLLESDSGRSAGRAGVFSERPTGVFPSGSSNGLRGLPALGLMLAFCGLSFGCTQSGSYVDYASLPSPALAVVNAGPSEAPAAPETEVLASPEEQPVAADSVKDQAATEPQTSNPATDSPTPDATQDSSTDPQAMKTSASGIQQAAATITEPSPTVTPAAADAQASVQAETGTRTEPQTSDEPLEIKLLVPQKSFRPEGESDALRVSYDDIDLLKILNMEPVPPDADQHFPDWLQNLDGKHIRIRGFMYPTFKATGLTKFTLARDNGICCFVRQPKVYDVIAIRLAKGETTNYIDNKPFDVEGTFRIVPEADDTELFQLYRIEDARVLN